MYKITTGRKNFGIKAKTEHFEGQTMEKTIEKVLAGKEKVELVRQPIYTERKLGVLKETDIRTDTHELMREAIENATGKYYQNRLTWQNESEPGKEKSTETGQ